MSNYPTPHINAKPEDFARTVLMPGDPLRSKLIAETFFKNPVLVNNVRGIQGYTGIYKDIRLSVMASGMGMPSMAIYSHELYTVFGVQNIIRIGSAGSIRSDIKLRDIVIGQGSCTDSRFAEQFHLPGTYAPICSYAILEKCVDVAKNMDVPYHVGNFLSSDHFYNDESTLPEEMKSNTLWRKMGVMAVEMETAALYMNAARHGKNALAICTVSDNLSNDTHLSAEDRQNSFTQMMMLALETARQLE